jgi:Fe-S-cluster containining protein
VHRGNCVNSIECCDIIACASHCPVEHGVNKLYLFVSGNQQGNQGSARVMSFSKLCAMCSTGCCTHVCPPITSERKRIIDRYLQDQEIETRDWLNSRSRRYAFPRETSDGSCIFFSALQRTCRIHPVKPETCRAGPITFDLDTRQERVIWYMKSSDDCLIAAELCCQPDVLSRYLSSAKKAVYQLICQLESSALQELLLIDEPTVVQIGEDPFPCKIT